MNQHGIMIFQFLKIEPNKFLDDGRGDSPRLRPIYSLPRPSDLTLAHYNHATHKPFRGLEILIKEITDKQTIRWENILVQCNQSPYVAEMVNSMLFSMARTESLFELYKSLSNNNNYRDDLLRSSVVLTHATMEDCLRTIAAYYLPISKEDILNKIPLTGAKDSKGQPYKFYLGELEKFKSMTIDDLIKKSVHDYISRQTYNNSKDIVSLLQDIGLKKDMFQKYYNLIDEMCTRRHQIVHRADRSSNNDNAHFDEISLSQVELWRGNAFNFIASLSFDCAWKNGHEFLIINSNDPNDIKRTIFNRNHINK